MSSPHHASIPAWAWAVPLLASALVALKLAHLVPSDNVYVLVLAGLFLGATVFAAVHHAEVLALKLGEPFGSILLAVAVTVIEAGLIVSIMLAGGEGSERVARDTVFAAVMIVLNGVVGLCLVLGAGKHFEQAFQLQGAASALAVLGTLATLGADPAQLRRGCFLPILFHSAAGGHRSHVAGSLVRVCVRANRQAS
jgi:Ca2+:H+ antiporter